MHVLLVNYHYFREEKPEKGIYPLSLSEFVNQVEILAKNYEFISQDELIDSFNKPLSKKKKCLLTFDDGLKEQMDVFEVLLSKGIPGVFYVATDAIEKQKAVDVHKMHFVRSKVSDEEIFDSLAKNYSFTNADFNPETLAAQYRYDDFEAQKLKYAFNFLMKKLDKDKFVDGLFNQITSENEFVEKYYMSTADMKKLNEHGSLGTHSASHQPLGHIDISLAKDDIERSIKFIEKITGTSPKSISYPYGGPTAVPDIDDSYFEGLGLKFGLTMFRGVNTDFKNKFQLKRVDTNDAPGGKSYTKGLYI